MSVKHMALVWEHADADGSEMLVLLALADFADADGWCWPAMGTLAKRARIKERAARMAVRRLEGKGLILCQLSRGGKGRGNRYRITVNPAEYAALSEDNPADGAVLDKPQTRQNMPPKPPNPAREGTKPGTTVPPNHQEPPKEKKEYTPAFLEFWAVYPKRLEKKAVAAKFRAAVKSGVSPQHLIDAAIRYAAWVSENRVEERYIKHPTTWFNKGCWDDELKPQRTTDHGKAARTDTLFQLADGVDERIEANSPVDHRAGSGDAKSLLPARSATQG